MPIVTVELLGEPPLGLAARLADPLGAIFESPAGHTWVRVVAVDPASYAESGGAAPPAWAFVRVILRALPDEDGRAALARRIGERVAAESGRSVEDVHVLFEPPAAGRIAFGGELVRGGR